MRLRIRSVRNIAQVTRALQTMSASKVRRAQAAVLATRPYAVKALEVLGHLAKGRSTILHPMLIARRPPRNILVILVSGDRGLAGAYNANVVRWALTHFQDSPAPVHYIVIGRKGREMLHRAGVPIIAEFSRLPPAPSYADLSAIGRMAIKEYSDEETDEVHIVFTQFVNMMQQRAAGLRLLPLPEFGVSAPHAKEGGAPVYLFEPGQTQLLETVIDRLVSIEIYESILESMASEHAARMVTMRNATDNAHELIGGLQLEYNKARQQSITGDLLDIAAGTEALSAQAGEGMNRIHGEHEEHG
jgi:F-type H+-transporting ATPase subunit gamma